MTTHPIRFGIASGQQLYQWAQLVELWKTADQLGYDSLWVSDHLYPILVPDLSESNFEGWTTLSALSQHTSSAKVGALVNCNGFRNPSLTAKMAATVDHASSGRFILGLARDGSSWSTKVSASNSSRRRIVYRHSTNRAGSSRACSSTTRLASAESTTRSSTPYAVPSPCRSRVRH